MDGRKVYKQKGADLAGCRLRRERVFSIVGEEARSQGHFFFFCFPRILAICPQVVERMDQTQWTNVQIGLQAFTIMAQAKTRIARVALLEGNFSCPVLVASN